MWKPSEAAAFRAASATAFLREIASDGRALRGVHRLLSIAERRGGEVTFAGVKFSGLQSQAGQQWLRERESVLNEHSTTNGENAGSSAASVQGHQRPQRTQVEAAEAATSSKPKAVGSPRARSRRQPGPPQTRPAAPIKWRASKPKRFGIKKAWQKMRAAARVGAMLRRWVSRARTSLREAALACVRAPPYSPSLKIVATPRPHSATNLLSMLCSSTIRPRPGSSELANPQSLLHARLLQVWGSHPWGQPGPHQETRHGRAGDITIRCGLMCCLHGRMHGPEGDPLRSAPPAVGHRSQSVCGASWTLRGSGHP